MKQDFSPPFSAEVMNEAMAYNPSETPSDESPEGLDPDQLPEFYTRSMGGDSRVIPILKKLIQKYPTLPILKNYLSVGLHQCGRHRQAEEVERETFRLHPDYLFARLSEGKRMIEKKDFKKAREILGQNLNLTDIYPTDEEIHTSHWSNYYVTVAEFYIDSEDLMSAQGVINALKSKLGNDKKVTILDQRLTFARLNALHKIIEKDKKNAIRVKPQRKQKPSGQKTRYVPIHSLMEKLYEFDTNFPPKTLKEILALPRESVVQDLVGIIEEGIANAPHYFSDGNQINGWEQIHALFLLSEMEATESIETILSFLGQHPDYLNFYLGDFISWEPVLGVISGNLTRLAAWMKTPGLAHSGRDCAAWAVCELASISPERHGEAVQWLADLLEFYRDSPPKDNILDTDLVTTIVSCLATLRATEHIQLIRDVYAKGYVSEFLIGTLEETLSELTSPLKPEKLQNHNSMMAFYRYLRKKNAPLPEFNSLLDENSLLSQHPEPPQHMVDIGRNDPCPCGSNKKYKKCCMMG